MSTSNRTEIRERFLLVETANVSDVLDSMGLTNQALSADFVPRSGTHLAGWAYTISGDSISGGPRPMNSRCKRAPECRTATSRCGRGPETAPVTSGS